MAEATHPAAGPPQDLDALLPLLYGELHRLASRMMERQRADHTLQPTALVHEACLKLLGRSRRWNHGGHFLAVAAKAMRSVLVDHSRTRAADKRGGGQRTVALPDADLIAGRDGAGVLRLDEALESLVRLDPQLAQLVELRCFAGCSIAECADVLGVSPRTVKRSWQVARAWLRRELRDGRHGRDA